jgi:hypothetical protein
LGVFCKEFKIPKRQNIPIKIVRIISITVKCPFITCAMLSKCNQIRHIIISQTKKIPKAANELHLICRRTKIIAIIIGIT